MVIAARVWSNKALVALMADAVTANCGAPTVVTPAKENRPITWKDEVKPDSMSYTHVAGARIKGMRVWNCHIWTWGSGAAKPNAAKTVDVTVPKP